MRTLTPFAGLVLLALSAAAFGLSHSEADPGGAFAFEHYVTDATLHRRWAVLADRDHPERPWIAVPDAARISAPAAALPDAKSSLAAPHAGVVGQIAQAAAQIQRTPPSGAAPRIVTPGMTVTLWQVSGDARIELSGMAIDGAALGGMVHVRTGPEHVLLTGIVRGPGSVELTGLARQQWGQP